MHSSVSQKACNVFAFPGYEAPVFHQTKEKNKDIAFYLLLALLRIRYDLPEVFLKDSEQLYNQLKEATEN